MIYAFDDNKNKVEVLKVVKTSFKTTSDYKNVTVPYPTNFNLNNTLVLNHAIKMPNDVNGETFYLAPEVYRIILENNSIKVRCQSLIVNETYEITLILARTN